MDFGGIFCLLVYELTVESRELASLSHFGGHFFSNCAPNCKKKKKPNKKSQTTYP